jgi:hypothetical protein
MIHSRRLCIYRCTGKASDTWSHHRSGVFRCILGDEPLVHYHDHHRCMVRVHRYSGIVGLVIYPISQFENTNNDAGEFS